MGVEQGENGRLFVVHQMGKVGSSAVCQALREFPGLRTEFTHMLNRETLAAYIRRKRREGAVVPDHAWDSLSLWRTLRETDGPIHIVSAVRGPMARNISAMFQNLPAGFGREPTAENLEALTRRFLMLYPHSTPLRWFDKQLFEPLGLDVYSRPFDHETRSLTLESGRFKVLVLRAEDADEVKQEVASGFFDLPGLTLRRANVGAEKGYAALYQAFVRSFEPPEWLLEKCYRSQYCTHFYTPDEIDRFRSRWTGRGAAEIAA